MFIGRSDELKYCKRLAESGESSILIVHGRRRVGKTTLIEKAFGQRNLIKIEGLEGATPKQQLYSAVQQLAPYFREYSITSWNPKTWGDFFRLLAPLIRLGSWTLFLEEYQWLSSYKTNLTAELKLAWDSHLSKNTNLLLILCGSSPSFMIGKVLKSKALHNRSQHELAVKPLPFMEARKFLSPKLVTQSAFDGYLLVGGVPEYLKRLSKASSVMLDFWKEFSNREGFFYGELERIFVSSLAENPMYRRIIEQLAKRRFATRQELAQLLKAVPGGSFSALLKDLEASGFIEGYHPIDKDSGSLLERFRILDPFLITYFSLRNVRSALPPISRIKSHLGYAFENFCRANADAIAKILGFSGIDYSSGSYFSRTIKERSFQVDLLFLRADKVHTICEIKYTDAPVGGEIVRKFERTLSLYQELFKSKTIQRVLISAAGVDQALKNRGVFDRVIDLEELISASK